MNNMQICIKWMAFALIGLSVCYTAKYSMNAWCDMQIESTTIQLEYGYKLNILQARAHRDILLMQMGIARDYPLDPEVEKKAEKDLEL